MPGFDPPSAVSRIKIEEGALFANKMSQTLLNLNTLVQAFIQWLKGASLEDVGGR